MLKQKYELYLFPDGADMESRFGFIHDKLDIKILILFVLRRLSEPVTLDKLAELTLCDGGISYFDFAECVDELITTGHIEADGDSYTITEKGIRNGSITENGLPYSVRVKAEKSATAANAQLRRQSMITTSRSIRRGGGYSVDLSLSDGMGEILSLELYAANEAQAIDIEKGFRERAESVFNVIIEELLKKQ